MDRSFEMIVSIPDQLTIAKAILITLAILVSCGLSRVYVHKGRNHDPGHTPVLCTKYAAAVRRGPDHRVRLRRTLSWQRHRYDLTIPVIFGALLGSLKIGGRRGNVGASGCARTRPHVPDYVPDGAHAPPRANIYKGGDSEEYYLYFYFK